ncbi:MULTISPECIES: VOC family protein [unclassified Cryobacterium]|uniref:VOC family protein n=1 Tax=unclassified Cryobacterium TaxID=2649013 RepID=UPI002AB3DFB0|nr:MULTISPECIES: VOC family protein [unclassified Cryobacterium]MDY7541093.1 VOC family protein [Cryobacterium sp. 5B3]MEA9999947.1 VOC family protein [Cryobacterium sp. RTS3]MEB0266312.1 VOC family protein [Cryobacterium sp. 10I5]MEB0275266.1 VOC family protein [Cryobacterium sp. 5B3]
MPGKIGNIVFDWQHPRELSHFWADVLGYPRAEWPPELRELVLTSDLTEADLETRSIAGDPEGKLPRLFFQRVPEGKTVKNRVHLDINAVPGRAPSREEVDAERDRIVALGASVLRVVDESWGPFPEYHVIMADPEGNEFCVQ